MVAAKVIKPVSLEEFIEFALRPENSEREFELIYGRIVEKMPGRTTNSFIAVQIDRKSYSFCEAHNIPSYVSIGDGAYIVEGHTVAPDFAYKPTPMIGDYPDPEPPLWAVEVISPTDKANDIRDKRNIYIEAGILLWEIYPLRREVDVYSPGQLLRTVDIEGMLDGGDVLPGFEVPVKDLFPKE